MSRLTVHNTSLAGLKLIERQHHGDSRGFLSRIFCSQELAAAGWVKPVVQINQTLTQTQGTIRGMHFQQTPHAEMKLVSCLKGRVWDVAVDLRIGSPTFLQWHAEELSETNMRALLIPEGFAHGFQTLSDDCELLYLHSAAYAQQAEVGLHPHDTQLAINWPLSVSELSTRDAHHPMIDHQFKGVAP